MGAENLGLIELQKQFPLGAISTRWCCKSILIRRRRRGLEIKAISTAALRSIPNVDDVILGHGRASQIDGEEGSAHT